ncbi:hypothetical protein [Pseudotenacibaculum haliotis]|uniref:Uncharacterized protein n=1 Tax=Pseudotenacibaculum haliotis TaxID=1862138 RepID=A0ABW5LUR1_9FLAO
MHKKLITKAFEKAKKDRKKIGDMSPSKSNLAEDISDYLDEYCNCILSPESLKQYYNKANDIKSKKEDISIKQIPVITGLCYYLGYSSYEKFLIAVGPWYMKVLYFIILNKPILIISIITIVTSWMISSASVKRWMVWDGLEYVEVSFDIEKYDDGTLKLYNADLIRNFKKIKNPDCNTRYFNEKGEKITWYYKRGNNNLEIFTAPGIHPVNGRTLDDITRHMIQTHICESY